MPAEQRIKIEKYIEEKLLGIKNIDSFYIEKKEKDSVNVIVVSSNLTPASSSAIVDVERTINQDFGVFSRFQVLQSV